MSKKISDTKKFKFQIPERFFSLIENFAQQKLNRDHIKIELYTVLTQKND